MNKEEWRCKMTAERTERFEPPMWKDINNIYRFGFIKNFGNFEEHYLLDIDKSLDSKWAITVETTSDDYIFTGLPTEQNYIRACEIVRDLFNKGGAK